MQSALETQCSKMVLVFICKDVYNQRFQKVKLRPDWEVQNSFFILEETGIHGKYSEA